MGYVAGGVIYIIVCVDREGCLRSCGQQKRYPDHEGCHHDNERTMAIEHR